MSDIESFNTLIFSENKISAVFDKNWGLDIYKWAPGSLIWCVMHLVHDYEFGILLWQHYVLVNCLGHHWFGWRWFLCGMSLTHQADCPLRFGFLASKNTQVLLVETSGLFSHGKVEMFVSMPRELSHLGRLLEEAWSTAVATHVN